MAAGDRVQATTRSETDWQVVLTKAPRIFGKIVTYVILAIGAAIFALPFLWMVSTSVKPEYLVYQIPIVWIPPELDFSHFVSGWKILPFLAFYRNTIFLTVVNIIGLVLSSSLVAFGFARIRFVGRDWIFLVLLATMMLPGQITLIPLYVFWAKLGAVNSFWPLIVPQWLANAYNVFLLRQFFMTISPELDDAARIDGAGWSKIYSRIVMPQAKPALGVVAIQAFAWNWNSFLGPLIYLNEPRKFTIAIGLSLFETQQSENMGETMAMSLVALVPVLIMFFVAQRYFIQGIVISGVKG